MYLEPNIKFKLPFNWCIATLLFIPQFTTGNLSFNTIIRITRDLNKVSHIVWSTIRHYRPKIMIVNTITYPVLVVNMVAKSINSNPGKIIDLKIENLATIRNRSYIQTNCSQRIVIFTEANSSRIIR